MALKIQAACTSMAEAERGRWALWLPVFFGFGISVYFALPLEPQWAPMAILTIILVLLSWLFQRFGATVLTSILIPLSVLLAGVSLASFHSEQAGAPALTREMTLSGFEGKVVFVERFANGPRVRLEALSAKWGLPEYLKAVRIKLRKGDAPELGTRISLTVRLSPPPEPAYPGAYDFSRRAWFEGLGAVGFSLSQWETVPSLSKADLSLSARLGLDAVRLSIGDKIRRSLPGREGEVAVALLTGDRSGLDEESIDHMRHSGLAHLLAISGLHIGMVAMTVFVTVRFLLALYEPFARDYPIKKWAAVVSLLAAFIYLLLAGATVPTQRAFLMTGIVLVAVLTDRQAISMRLVAFAAVIVLIISPEALVGASFQLSFAAVVSLVAVYESFKPHKTRLTEMQNNWPGRVAFYLLLVCLTTVIAGTATGPFAAHHFGRVAQYSVLANLLAVPIVTFWVMPAGMVALILMPFGLSYGPFILMGMGIEAVLWVAEMVSGIPGAVLSIPSMSRLGFACFVLGGIWIAIWQRQWRWLGVPLIFLGLSTGFTKPVPVAIFYSKGQGALVWDGKLWIENLRRDRFAHSIWTEKTALPIGGDWKDLTLQDHSPLNCGPLGCIASFKVNGKELKISLSRDPRSLLEDCRHADIVRLTIVPHPAACQKSQALLISPATMIRNGVHVIYPAGSDPPRVETVQSQRGSRPWSN